MTTRTKKYAVKNDPKSMISEPMKSSIPSTRESTREETFATGGCSPCSCACVGGVRFHQAIASASAGSDSTCVTGSFVSFRNRPTRSLRSHPDFVPGNVETMSSSVRSS